jgi:phosphatidylglycerophosphate synthase
MHYSVLIYVPNVIGYIRLIILITGWFFYDSVYVFLPLYSLSAFLDGIDGCVARALGQCSAFGAWVSLSLGHGERARAL